MQISDIHQFYTRNVEVHTMDDMDFIMSSISSSNAAQSSWSSCRSFLLSTLLLTTTALPLLTSVCS